MTMSANDQHTAYHNAIMELKNQKNQILQGTVSTEPAISNGKYAYVVRVDSLCSMYSSHNGVLKKKNLLCFSFKAIPMNAKITAFGAFSPPIPKQNPGAYDDYLNCISNDIWGRFYADSVQIITCRKPFSNAIRFYIKNTLEKACSNFKSNEYKGIIIASLINDKSELSDDMKQLFFKAGIYHLLALSGFNVAILAGMLMFFLSILPMSRIIKTLIILVFIWGFYLFIGPIPSLFRAVVMTTVVLSGYLFQRKSYTLNSLGLAGIIWLVFSPESLFTVSYQLSFSATFGLICLFPVLNEVFSVKKRSFLNSHILNPIISVFLVSLSAFIATIPVLCFHFGCISFSGIFANLFSVWLMSMAMVFALVGFLFQMVLPFFAIPCMAISELLIATMISLCSIVANIPFSIIKIPHLHYSIYMIYLIFILGLCAIHVSFFKKYLWSGLLVFLLLSMGIFFIDKSFAQPQITAFYGKKDFLWGIRWPDKSLGIAGFGQENQEYSSFLRIVTPWIRTNYDRNIEEILLSTVPCKSIHFLEPFFKESHTRKVYSFPQTDQSGYVTKFFDEYKAKLLIVDPNYVVTLSPKASFVFIDANKTVSLSQPFLKIGMGNSQILLGDTAFLPTAKTGALLYSFSKSGAVNVKQFIKPQHPVYGFLE